MMHTKIDHLNYLPGMEIINSDIKNKVLQTMENYDYKKITAQDVEAALSKQTKTITDFAALLSPVASEYIEVMAKQAKALTRQYFGNNVYVFTPLYLANYCENHCVYCGFNSHNKIQRAKLSIDEIKKEMQAIAQTGLEEILLLTGESRKMSDVGYIAQAVMLAKEYFKTVGLEIYPLNTEEYTYLHQCGADYVTVFQETYAHEVYEKLHLAGRSEERRVGKEC